jgi:hypothetical protein
MDVPHSVGGAEYGDVAGAVAVVVAGHGDVAVRASGKGLVVSARAGVDTPHAGGGRGEPDRVRPGSRRRSRRGTCRAPPAAPRRPLPSTTSCASLASRPTARPRPPPIPHGYGWELRSKPRRRQHLGHAHDNMALTRPHPPSFALPHPAETPDI